MKSTLNSSAAFFNFINQPKFLIIKQIGSVWQQKPQLTKKCFVTGSPFTKYFHQKFGKSVQNYTKMDLLLTFLDIVDMLQAFCSCSMLSQQGNVVAIWYDTRMRQFLSAAYVLFFSWLLTIYYYRLDTPIDLLVPILIDYLVSIMIDWVVLELRMTERIMASSHTSGPWRDFWHFWRDIDN